jgi:hypothetical protein
MPFITDGHGRALTRAIDLFTAAGFPPASWQTAFDALEYKTQYPLFSLIYNGQGVNGSWPN